MGLIKEPFDQLVATLGATHNWPLTGTDPANLEVLGGSADLGVDITRLRETEGAVLAPADPTLYATVGGNNWGLTITGMETHYTNAGLSEYTVLFFYREVSGGVNDAMDFDQAGKVDTPPQEGVNMMAFIVNADGTWRRHTNSTSTIDSTATLDPAVDGIGNGLIFTSGTVAVGHILYFPRALVQDELVTLHRQRRFLGKVNGTATVDGAGAAATIRAFARDDDAFAGEVTASADGSFELWTDHGGPLDILALAPDGTASRPIVHGPLEAVHQN